MDIITLLGEALMLILKTLATEIGKVACSVNESTSLDASCDSPLVYSPDDLASKLGLSRASVDRWLLSDPPFPIKRVGKKILIPAQEFDLWLKNQNEDWRNKNHGQHKA